MRFFSKKVSTGYIKGEMGQRISLKFGVHSSKLRNDELKRSPENYFTHLIVHQYVPTYPSIHQG